MQIPLLTKDDVECRVATVNKNKTGASLLLYKNARVDMRILDEVFGAMNWRRSHEVINNNLFCNIDIWDSDKKEWVRKQDVGVESYTEKEKGEASDSFKRAGFNWGIGRELYTAPFIWVTLTAADIRNDKVAVRFKVQEIGYNDQREINKLTIADDKGTVRYKMNGYIPKVQPKNTDTDPLGVDPKCVYCAKDIIGGKFGNKDYTAGQIAALTKKKYGVYLHPDCVDAYQQMKGEQDVK